MSLAKAAAEPEVVATEKGPRARSRARISRQLRRVPLPALVAVGLFVVIGVAGPWLAPYDPNHVDLNSVRQSFSGQHWLGTDALGRDELSRLLTAARTSLVAIALVLGLSILIGAVVGVVAGVTGGIVDEVLMRLTDVGLSIPSLVMALAVLGARGPGYYNMILALTLCWWPAYARLTRVAVVSLRQQPHIEATRLIGVPPLTVLVRHLLPPAVAPTLVFASGDAGFVALAVATLSFLGLGLQPPGAEWGQMLVDGLAAMGQYPMLVILPGLALTLTIVGLNLLGEALALDSMPRDISRRTLRRRIAKLPPLGAGRRVDELADAYFGRTP